MNDNQIKILKKEHAKGEDGYKTFSVRLKEETVFALDKIATESNRSRNELINIFLEHGVKNYKIIEQEATFGRPSKLSFVSRKNGSPTN